MTLYNRFRMWISNVTVDIILKEPIDLEGVDSLTVLGRESSQPVLPLLGFSQPIDEAGGMMAPQWD